MSRASGTRASFKLRSRTDGERESFPSRPRMAAKVPRRRCDARRRGRAGSSSSASMLPPCRARLRASDNEHARSARPSLPTGCGRRSRVLPRLLRPRIPRGGSGAAVVDDAAPDGEATVQLWGAEDKAAGLSRIRATVMLEVPTALLGTSLRRPTRRRVCALVLDGAPGRLLLLADAVHSGMLRHRTEFGPRARFAAVAATSESRGLHPVHRRSCCGGDYHLPWFPLE